MTKKHTIRKILFNVPLPLLVCLIAACSENADREFVQVEIFPLVMDHSHGSTIAELPNGDLLAAWFQGSGERWADDVRIMGARMSRKSNSCYVRKCYR